METAMDTLLKLSPILTDEDHRRALEAMEGLWGAEPGSEEYGHLDALATLIEAYETRRWPAKEMDPVEAISSAIESGQHTRAELAELIGQSRATEVLKRKRYLTLPMIRQISESWGLPVGTLVKKYDLSATTKGKVRSRLCSAKVKAARTGARKRARSEGSKI
jgi:HTH-type transcriptional regulator/antitoxin HigA